MFSILGLCKHCSVIAQNAEWGRPQCCDQFLTLINRVAIKHRGHACSEIPG